MAKAMKMATCVFAAATLILYVAYRIIPNSTLLALVITAGTTLYHLGMRLAVGGVVDAHLHNRVDHTKPWFQPLAFEAKLYKRLGVKLWKKHLPAYQPELFDLKKHSFMEIAGAMCQAELVHEIIVVLSFVPVLFVPLLGAFWVFLITSILAAAFDLCFVMIQRYNRPRIVKCIKTARV